MPFILTELRGNIFEISLNRPDKRNAMNWELLEELQVAFIEAEKHYNQQTARAVVITAQGTFFSSGIDLESFTVSANKYGDNWRDNLFPMTDDLQRIFTKVEQCSLPVICVISGLCIGLGLELALACDFRIAAARTRFSLPESRLGMIPDVGGTARLLNLVNTSIAKDIIMTGRTFDAEYAERHGIVNYVVPKEDLMKKTEEFVTEIALAAPMAVSYTKRTINDMAETQRKLQIEAWAQAQLLRTEDFLDAVQAVISKQPVTQWKGK
jgi:enoyl-CoA hydratase/carnithine racemase